MTLVHQFRTWNIFREGIFSGLQYAHFSSLNTAIHYIRHAVSLDEICMRYKPQLYRNEDLTIVSEVKKKWIREKNNAELQAGYPDHGGYTNLKEVWFAGSHRGKLPSE